MSMRKRTKLIAVLSAAALLAAGAAMTSFAASGWQEENGTWVYLDRDGNRVTDTWKKSGNQYFYLDESGVMATNALVEYNGELYYVDANGARATNQWISISNDDGQWDEEVDTIYYRFGSTGKAFRDDKKTIDGKIYIFDDEGHMLSGWQTYGDDNDLYYLGTEYEGWAYTGWQYLDVSEDYSVEYDDEGYDDEEFFYFRPNNGKAYRDTRKYINGHYYTFDENGVMNDKWVTGTPGAPDYTGSFGVSTNSHALYTEDMGNQQTGWVYVYAPDDPGEDGDQYWYYLDSKGVPFNEQAKDSYHKASCSIAVKIDGDKWQMDGWLPDTDDIKNNVAARVIKGKTYLFDEDGKMLTGLYYLRGVKRTGGFSDLGLVEKNDSMPGSPVFPVNANLPIDGGYYYFNTEAGSKQGQMMTGRQSITYEGEDYYYHFQKNGMAYTNTIVDGFMYGRDGSSLKARADKPYDLIYIAKRDAYGNPYWISEKGNNKRHTDCVIVVDPSGKVKKSGTTKFEGYKYIIRNYEVIATEAVD